MATLLENYKQRLTISESVYAQNHAGAKMPETKKLITAKLLENTAKWLNESLDNSVPTQRSAMGAFKKFALKI